jgi:iron complex transport system substrate-binding protein
MIPKGAESREIDRVVKEHARHGWPLYDLDVRRIEELDPQLVLTQAVCDVCAVSEGQASSAIGTLSIEPEIVSLHPHRFADVLSDILSVGKAAGVPERAADLVAESRRRIERVQARVAGRERVSVVVLEWLEPLFSAGHWTPDIVAMAGGENLLSRPGDRSRELTWSEVRAADPDFLILACCGLDEDRTIADVGHLVGQPGFQQMKAVRSGRVFAADGGAHFSRPGPRLLDTLELLAETLHPSGEADALAFERVRALG